MGIRGCPAGGGLGVRDCLAGGGLGVRDCVAGGGLGVRDCVAGGGLGVRDCVAGGGLGVRGCLARGGLGVRGCLRARRGPGSFGGPGFSCGLALGRGFSFFPKHIGVNFERSAHSLSPAGYLLGFLFECKSVADRIPTNENLSQDNPAV